MRVGVCAAFGLVMVMAAGCSSEGTTMTSQPKTSTATDGASVGAVPANTATDEAGSEVQASPSSSVPFLSSSPSSSSTSGSDSSGSSGSGSGDSGGGSSEPEADSTGDSGSPSVPAEPAPTVDAGDCPLLSLVEIQEATGMKPGRMLDKSAADRQRIAARGGGEECGHAVPGLPGVLVVGSAKPVGGPKVEINRLKRDTSGGAVQEYTLGDGGVGKLSTVGGTTMYMIVFGSGDQLYTAIASTTEGAASEDLRNAAESLAEALAAK